MGVRYDCPSWRTLPSWRVFISLTVPGWFCSNTNGSLHQRRTHLELAAQSCCHPNRHLSSVHCFKQENESSGPANHTWSCCDNGALFAFGEAGLLGGGAHVSWHLSRDLNVEGSVCVARNHTLRGGFLPITPEILRRGQGPVKASGRVASDSPCSRRALRGPSWVPA